MLIPIEIINKYLLNNNIKVDGVLHIGSHICEEKTMYNYLGVTDEKIIWIDAIEEKVNETTANGVKNVYQSVITDTDDNIVKFNISNNFQSSSVLELKEHLIYHPQIHYVEERMLKTVTIDTFFKRNNLDPSQYNLWNFDIQGAELLALKGAKESIQFPKAIILEVNEKELYEECGLINEVDYFLRQHGFMRVITKMTHYGWGDALYIKNPLKLSKYLNN